MNALRIRTVFYSVTALAVALIAGACGGSGTFSPTATSAGGVVTPITISITAPSMTIYPGGTIQLQAIVTGTSNKAVTWSVSNSDQWSLSQTGLFTAIKIDNNETVKSKTGIVGHPFWNAISSITTTVTATSQADPTKTATVVLTIALPTITISPANSTITTGEQLQYTATVSYPEGVVGVLPQTVTWSLSGGGGVGNASISSTGLFLAGTQSTTYDVIATSSALGIRGSTTIFISAG